MLTNEELYARVMAKLIFEPNIDEKNIIASVKKDKVVVLGGKVKSFTEKRLAEESVERIEEVKGIANEIEVDLYSAYRRSDTDIVEAALNALKWTFAVPHEHIKVVVEKGHLTLVGDVEYFYQKDCAQKVVQDLYGVTSVTNSIKIKPQVSPDKIKEKIIAEFVRNARIDAINIEVEAEGGSVTLKGKVRNFDEEKEARNVAWSIPGVSNVINKLIIG